jgi:response regulator RpfG family c-di-GMP phosphodiesterase
MMPKMDGIQTTRKIRDMGYSGSVVALTANAIAESSEMFLSNGFDGYIPKPIDLRELNAWLNRLIRDKYPADVVEAARNQAKQKQPPAKPQYNRRASDRLAAIIVREVSEFIITLEKSFEKDLNLFTTTVHGLKSALGNLGETDLMEIAIKLEMSGKKKESDAIKAELPKFIEGLKALVDKHRN